MADREIHVHADELEYTRDGIRTPDPVTLEVGVHNRVVITRPERRPALAIPLAGFGVDSSFPTPAALAPFLAPEYEEMRARLLTRTAITQVYGHGQPEGNESKNKKISDRRAAVISALLARDVDRLLAVSDEDGWTLREQQVLLRIAGCDPGPIDGENGPLTAAAVERFQQAYRDGAFHTTSSEGPRDPELAVDGDLGPATGRALIDTLAALCRPGTEPARLHPTHPEVGCTEFNEHSDGAQRPAFSRRVTLVLHDDLPPFSDRAPCSVGDHSVCPVDDSKPHRCLWFRAHVSERPETDVVHTHWDLRWLPLANGSYLLSGLTTVSDDETVEFQVHGSRDPVDGPAPSDPSVFTAVIGEAMTTRPILGVAQVAWTPPGDFSPGEDGRIATGAGTRSVPVFNIRHHRSSAVTHDSWPSHHVVVLFDREFVDSEFAPHRATKIELVDDSAGYRAEASASTAEPYDEDHYAVRFSGVPASGTYSLLVHYGDEASRTILEDVPFDELDDHGPASPPPPSLDPPEAADTEGAETDTEEPTDGEPARQADSPILGLEEVLNDPWEL